ncbi:MAG: shikimate dehydrogenase [Dehalococcoidia bacterium]|nr:MAG: shikimate dehydrogenase [Dehalococcoidia bacterium]
MGNRVISGKTRICGIIGDPIEHTMSPVMHNAAFNQLGIDYLYVPFRVRKEELGKAIGGMRALNIRGLNVTIPHKVAVIPFLDELDPLAEKINAVNTIANDEGILTGYNTDATGFLQALLDREVELEGKNMVILGAGGASRAISFILAERGAHLIILNRLLELDWAEELASRISQIFTKEVEALELTDENLVKVLEKADILVNATSVGMSPNVDEIPVPANLLKPSLIVFDIVYNPIKTRLLREAEAAGAETIGGLDMLVWQGALAFEKWTGLKAPVELMKKEAIKVLEGREN